VIWVRHKASGCAAHCFDKLTHLVRLVAARKSILPHVGAWCCGREEIREFLAAPNTSSAWVTPAYSTLHLLSSWVSVRAAGWWCSGPLAAARKGIYRLCLKLVVCAVNDVNCNPEIGEKLVRVEP
jgi:hypothetical protein